MLGSNFVALQVEHPLSGGPVPEWCSLIIWHSLLLRRALLIMARWLHAYAPECSMLRP
jgi:hypothetical protein